MSAIVERIVSEWRDKEPPLDIFSRDELARFARAAILALAATDTFRRLIEDVHGAGYHDALTGVDPKQSQAVTVEAAINRFRAAANQEGT